MTNGERDIWIAVFAAKLKGFDHNHPAREVLEPIDVRRAAADATRVVQALRRVDPSEVAEPHETWQAICVATGRVPS